MCTLNSIKNTTLLSVENSAKFVDFYETLKCFYETWKCDWKKTFVKYGKLETLRHLYKPCSDEVSAATQHTAELESSQPPDIFPMNAVETSSAKFSVLETKCSKFSKYDAKPRIRT